MCNEAKEVLMAIKILTGMKGGGEGILVGSVPLMKEAVGHHPSSHHRRSPPPAA